VGELAGRLMAHAADEMEHAETPNGFG